MKQAITALMLTTASCTALAGPTCSWDNPGAARVYPVAIERLLDSYPEMDKATKSKLYTKLKWVKPDDYATITKDAIVGKRASYTNLRDMHWRDPNEPRLSKMNKVCKGAVTRAKWADEHKEQALIYIETEPSGKRWVVVVPLKCNNVSLADMLPPASTPEETPSGGDGSFKLTLQPYWPSMTETHEDFTPVTTPNGYIPPPVGVVYWPDIDAPRPPQHFAEGWGWWVGGQAAPIPEPETYAMMMLGLGVVAWASKRRKHVSNKV